jgi:hypothetical protein
VPTAGGPLVLVLLPIGEQQGQLERFSETDLGSSRPANKTLPTRVNAVFFSERCKPCAELRKGCRPSASSVTEESGAGAASRPGRVKAGRLQPRDKVAPAPLDPPPFEDTKQGPQGLSV